MVTLQDMADALDLKPKKDHKGFAAYGEIKSINPDNTYQVSLNGSDTTVKCARLTGAHVGDVVLVNVLDNGYAVVTGCVGGDTDALEALEQSGATVQHFWYDAYGAHVTEDTQEDYLDDPTNAGGNTLITSQGMAIRKGTTELASFSATGATIGQNVNGKTRAEISTAGLSIVQKIGNVDIGIAVLGYGAGVDEDGNPLDAPYYDIGQRAAATTKGNFSVVEGVGNAATAYSAHAEGYSTTATGACAHAEGLRSEASGDYAHAESIDTIANGDYAHAEGRETWATGDEAHAEGDYTRASGAASHAEGSYTTASGASSHAGGVGTKAGYTAQYAIGQYNDNKSTNIFEVGKGTEGAKSNAFEVSNTGDITAPGKATLGAINGDQLFDYSTVSMTSSSINANASGEVTSSASNKSKYYPIAITNVNISTGQASLRRFYFSTQQSGRAVVKIGLQNDGTSAKTISVSADILWIKTAV